MSDSPGKKNTKFMCLWMGYGVAIGCGIGVAMGNLALGIGPGVAIGAAIGALISKSRAKFLPSTVRQPVVRHRPEGPLRVGSCLSRQSVTFPAWQPAKLT
jgi:hypothetical protein